MKETITIVELVTLTLGLLILGLLIGFVVGSIHAGPLSILSDLRDFSTEFCELHGLDFDNKVDNNRVKCVGFENNKKTTNWIEMPYKDYVKLMPISYGGGN